MYWCFACLESKDIYFFTQNIQIELLISKSLDDITVSKFEFKL
jgi:hypothetical protein